MQVRNEAAQGIHDAVTTAATVVTAQLDDSTSQAQRVVALAERLQKGLGLAAAGRMALALLPLATVLVMLATSV
ncbi:hypothetical protein [Microbacterium stercoris]|uniref:Uncharacterized protein n=1 Tax=Microbacterium stercoris TaxID=2820289 RepID=A0A939QGU0_9MICO|nr:hypothetical protein [Microbacterium stercoris]MBO3662689.1 hypothetical protein [Microbacterium stercoris]